MVDFRTDTDIWWLFISSIFVGLFLLLFATRARAWKSCLWYIFKTDCDQSIDISIWLPAAPETVIIRRNNINKLIRQESKRAIPECVACAIQIELIWSRSLTSVASPASQFKLHWSAVAAVAAAAAEITRISIRFRKTRSCVRDCEFRHCDGGSGGGAGGDGCCGRELMMFSPSLWICLSWRWLLVSSEWMSFLTPGSFPSAALSDAPFLVWKVLIIFSCSWLIYFNEEFKYNPIQFVKADPSVLGELQTIF